MKKLINKKGMIVLLLVLLTGTEVFAQNTTTRRRKTNAGNNSQQSLNNNAVVNPATGNMVTPPPADTSITGNNGISQRPDNIFGMQDTSRKSMRTDGIVERNLNKNRTPLSYQYIREDDAVWGKRI